MYVYVYEKLCVFKLRKIIYLNFSVQFSLVSQSCPTFCDTVDCSTPGLPGHHKFPESTQTPDH